jgi:hypothetical protein
MLRKSMIILAIAAALTGGPPADALARGGGGGGFGRGQFADSGRAFARGFVSSAMS